MTWLPHSWRCQPPQAAMSSWVPGVFEPPGASRERPGRGIDQRPVGTGPPLLAAGAAGAAVDLDEGAGGGAVALDGQAFALDGDGAAGHSARVEGPLLVLRAGAGAGGDVGFGAVGGAGVVVVQAERAAAGGRGDGGDQRSGAG